MLVVLPFMLIVLYLWETIHFSLPLPLSSWMLWSLSTVQL